MAALGPILNEQLSCDYHQLLVKVLSPCERESNGDLVRYLDRSIKIDF